MSQRYRIIGLVLATLACCQYAMSQTRIRVMEWNVENLFDTDDDPQKNDNDFLPSSERRWTPRRYWQKLNDVGKTIMAVGKTGLPDVIGLCEVENDSVMHRLTQRSALRNTGYSYIMTSSGDARGIDCALMYQPLHFGLTEWRAIRVPSARHGFSPTRDILYAKGSVGKSDTLHVLVCHAPSQRGGQKGKRHRQLVMATLQAVIDSLRGKNVVVMGDFNSQGVQLRNMRSLKSRNGTYRYQGDWEQLDYIFVTPRLKCDTMSVARFPFLLEKNKRYGGYQPRRTYRGPAYHGGISDHLPIWADIKITPSAASKQRTNK